MESRAQPSGDEETLCEVMSQRVGKSVRQTEFIGDPGVKNTRVTLEVRSYSNHRVGEAYPMPNLPVGWIELQFPVRINPALVTITCGSSIVNERPKNRFLQHWIVFTL